MPFGQLAEVLSQKLFSEVGVGLTEDSKLFLAQKAFRNKNIDNYENLSLSWDQFNDDTFPGPLPDNKPFTFFEWFYAIMKTLKDHLGKLWRENKIVGFISRQNAENLLSYCSPGTFFLSFSDSIPGAITVSAVSSSGTVVSLEPFNSNDLNTRCLANRLRDLQMLNCLYPNMPKEEAFGEHYTTSELKSPNGYIKIELKTCVPG